MNNPRIHIVRKSEIIGVDDEALQRTAMSVCGNRYAFSGIPSKNMQFDAQKLLRIRPEIFEELVQLARRAGGCIIQRRIYH